MGKYKNKPVRYRLSSSVSLEASLVIPIFIFAVMAVVYFIQIIQVKSVMLQAMYNDVRMLSRYVYSYEQSCGNDKEQDNSQGYMSAAITASFAKAKLLEYLPKDFSVNNRIAGGDSLIIVDSTNLFDGKNINLNVIYTVKNPFSFFSLFDITVKQTLTSRAWTGSTESDEENEKQDEEKVFVTATGTVYHRDKNCTYLKPSVRVVDRTECDSIRNLSGGKYYACERCAYKNNGSTVYITDYGDRYHCDRNCSSIKRGIFEILLSEAEGKKPCSKCGDK